MKFIATCSLIMSIFFYAGQFCFAQEGIVTAAKLTKGDVEKALLSGEITSKCQVRGLPDASGAASLNPETVIIKGIYQKDGTAKIHFMGRFKKSIRADAMPVVCEADLQRLDSGEWMDSSSGALLKK